MGCEGEESWKSPWFRPEQLRYEVGITDRGRPWKGRWFVE